ncbi:MAG: M28 family metallopeptidase [Ekhidna sp.]
MKKLLILTTFIAMQAWAQDDKTLVDQSVNKETIKSHIYFLASDELRGRDTGSPELKIAASYLQSRFMEYGVGMLEGMDTYVQDVPMKRKSPPSRGTINIGEEAFQFLDDFVLMDGANLDLDAPIVFLEYGMDDYTKKDIEGKIVVTLCGDGKDQSPQAWFSLSGQKGNKFRDLGAVALIELFNSPQIPWNILKNFFTGDQILLDAEQGEKPLPRVWMNRAADQLADLKKKKTEGSISISSAEEKPFISQNIIGVVEGTDENLKNEYVVYSAHYDHVGIGTADAKGDSIYNGARDNATGVVTVLSAAKNIAANPTKRSSLFILYTGEEKGLLGSNYFVENSPVSMEQIVYCFNSDNGGYNDTSKATIIGLGRTTAQDLIVKACEAFGLEAIDDPAPEQGLFDRSDNVHFARKGVPAPTFSLGFTAFDAEIGKYYHQPGDEAQTLDYDYLEKFFKSYVYACRLIGNADQTPFWKEGDKYYEAGKALYK